MLQATVLIPTYNCAKFLLECIGSILRQQYTDYEILIIDDASTDHTAKLIESINSSKIRYYKNSKNLGIVKALNIGIDLARGKYIARMDADDMMLGNRLQDQTKFLENNAEYGMVGGNYQVIDNHGIFKQNVQLSRSHNFLKLGLIFRNQFAHSAITMRAHILKELKYDANYQYCEDHDLWLRFAEVSKVTNLPSVYLNYRWHEANSCNKNQQELKKSVLALLSRELDKFEVEHSAEELMMHGSVCFGTGKLMFKDKNKLWELNKWYDKLFSSPVLERIYDKLWLENFRKDILRMYCNVISRN